MKQNIADVDFRLCGSELIALLLESDEIKKHQPVFNRSQRRNQFHSLISKISNFITTLIQIQSDKL
jgi:excinuclease UvrABC nuclease subunit